MQDIINYDKKSKKILKHIREDIEELIDVNEKNNKSIEEINSSILKIREELNKMDGVFDKKNTSKENMNESSNPVTSKVSEPQVIAEDEFDIPIRKRLLIRKTKRKSRTFRRWLFSNKDL